MWRPITNIYWPIIANTGATPHNCDHHGCTMIIHWSSRKSHSKIGDGRSRFSTLRKTLSGHWSQHECCAELGLMMLFFVLDRETRILPWQYPIFIYLSRTFSAGVLASTPILSKHHEGGYKGSSSRTVPALCQALFTSQDQMTTSPEVQKRRAR